MATYATCRNPSCSNTVLAYKQKRNHGGVRAYCSVSCRSAWPPMMAHICHMANLVPSVDALREYLTQLMAVHNFSVTHFCATFEMSRMEFYNLVKKLGIPRGKHGAI